ncbi:MAG: fibrillarin-like rRNA/tRNA 2'-O-methyltransferase [Nitrososphaerota archaeon]|nr:fibrillarin-like rRNA/tRNA 2'-O-methyltransferase [Nitrososphaerota archaeon]
MSEDREIATLFDGVYQISDPRNPSKKILATRNLTPGSSVYGETLVKRRLENEVVEFRSWDPFRSKLSAAILNELENFPFRKGTYCLYLGASTGTTVSHLSDIVGGKGRIFGVEMAPRVAREFLENVVKYRKNVIPIVEDAKHPERYSGVYGDISVVYSDVAQPDQTEIAVRNCKDYLTKGMLFLVVKASSIDTLKSKKQVFQEQAEIVQNSGFKMLELIDLEPFDKNHAIIVAVRI